jgi:hypothetical protein
MLNQRHDSGLSSRTVQYIHAVLRKALNVAVRDQLVHRNVAALVEPPRVTGKEVQPLTPYEARCFLEAVEDDRLAVFFTVAVSLGLRQGEALALRWRDLDLETAALRVRYSLQRLPLKAARSRRKAGDPRNPFGRAQEQEGTPHHRIACSDTSGVGCTPCSSGQRTTVVWIEVGHSENSLRRSRRSSRRFRFHDHQGNATREQGSDKAVSTHPQGCRNTAASFP